MNSHNLCKCQNLRVIAGFNTISIEGGGLRKCCSYCNTPEEKKNNNT